MNLRPRRYLPSIPQLLAFEAVMRSRSTTAAAQDLGLTQSTVSRLILTLEEQLGQPLFHRRRKRLYPTDAAVDYVSEVSRALNIVQHASMQIAVNPGGGGLSLATLPTFGTRWLAPRLGDFLTRHPGITLNFATRVPRFDFESESFDAVIFHGQPDWPQARHQKLFDECHVACASRGFLDRHPVSGAADVAALPLLHLDNRPDAWAQWFTAQGVTAVPSGGGMTMDQFTMIIQAARQGLGVALLPEYLLAAESGEERLIPLPMAPVRGGGAYWLAWPEARDKSVPLIAFRSWLAGQVAGPTTDSPA